MDIFSKQALLKKGATGLPSGTVIFDKSTAGTYTVTIPATQIYDVIMVGAGGGGDKGAIYTSYGGGGSGAAYVGKMQLTKGTVKVIVGAGGTNGFYGGTNPTSGGSTYIGNYYVGGGELGSGGGSGGAKGNCPTNYGYTTWVAGNAGKAGYSSSNGGASVYGGYGKGAPATGGTGGAGYVKIYVA